MKTQKRTLQRGLVHLARRSQGGYAVLSLVLLAVGIAAALIAVAATVSGSSTTRNDINASYANQIITQGETYVQAYQTLVVRGLATSKIRSDYSYGAAYNILDTTLGAGAVNQAPPAAAFDTSIATTFPYWLFQSGPSVAYLPNGGKEDVAYLFGLTKDVCNAINRQLGIGSITASGNAAYADYQTGGTSGLGWVRNDYANDPTHTVSASNSPTVSSPNVNASLAFNQAPGLALASTQRACVSAADNLDGTSTRYIYFTVLLLQ